MHNAVFTYLTPRLVFTTYIYVYGASPVIAASTCSIHPPSALTRTPCFKGTTSIRHIPKINNMPTRYRKCGDSVRATLFVLGATTDSMGGGARRGENTRQYEKLHNTPAAMEKKDNRVNKPVHCARAFMKTLHVSGSVTRRRNSRCLNARAAAAGVVLVETASKRPHNFKI